ncbi:dihydroorotase [Natronomonas sp.]|uniref:dihydroorotase n=1 Tax=Natronomonas sp. TaxID=2184060 RepID=UPI002635E905|nr:amidohydrolase family protein [Natronomonas sp.]
MVDTLIEGGEVVTAQGRSDADVAVTDGVIDRVGSELGDIAAEERIDATGRLVMPGAIDPHVHVEWPDWDYDVGARHGGRAAVAGGVTSVINFLIGPPGELRSNYEAFRAAMEEHFLGDFSFHAAVFTMEQVRQVPAFVEEEGITSFKLFLPYRGEEVVEPLVGIDDGIVYELLEEVAAIDDEYGAKALVHPENVEPSFEIKDEMRNAGAEGDSVNTWNEVRPDFLEADAINRLMLFADETGAPVHFVHMSSEKGMRAFQRNQSRTRAEVTAEIQVQHLTEDAREHGMLAKMNPPFRTSAEHDALWEGLRRDDLAFVSSDHAPCTTEHKDNIWDATVGIPNLQTWFPLFVTTALDDGAMSLPRVVEKTSYAPAEHYGLTPRKGGLWPGADADVIVVDPEERTEVRATETLDQSDFTPFEGREFVFPEVTMSRGDVVYANGEVLGEEGRAEFLSRPNP